jgi:hypothetical protein
MQIVLVIYRIHEPGKEKGFGQSILHDGQLIFHTPPYSLQDISLQDVCYPITGLKVTVNQDVSQTLKKSVERPRSVTDHNREESSSTKLNVASASPLISNEDKKPLDRRFSYTSIR